MRECLGRDSDGSTGYTQIFRSGKFNSFNHARYVLSVVGFFCSKQNVKTEKVGSLSVKVTDSTMNPADLVELAHSDPAAWDACFSLMPHWGKLSEAAYFTESDRRFRESVTAALQLHNY